MKGKQVSKARDRTEETTPPPSLPRQQSSEAGQATSSRGGGGLGSSGSPPRRGGDPPGWRGGDVGRADQRPRRRRRRDRRPAPHLPPPDRTSRLPAPQIARSLAFCSCCCCCFRVLNGEGFPRQVNARQQTERDPSKPAFKDGAVRQMCLVLLRPPTPFSFSSGLTRNLP